MDDEPLDNYGDTGIQSAHAPLPKWLKWLYVILPIWGIFWFYLYWNGSYGWLNRDHWFELQKAANTTFPEIRKASDQFPD